MESKKRAIEFTKTGIGFYCHLIGIGKTVSGADLASAIRESYSMEHPATPLYASSIETYVRSITRRPNGIYRVVFVGEMTHDVADENHVRAAMCCTNCRHCSKRDPMVCRKHECFTYGSDVCKHFVQD